MSLPPGRRVLGLFLVAAVVLAAGIGLRDPWPPDEPRFALIARDMAGGGDWLIPRVGGVQYPDKPPLFFWAVAAAYRATGSIEGALLLPGLASGLLVLWLAHDLARRLWNPQTALWAGAALVVTVQFPLQMKSGQIDGFLCLWTTLALYGLCRHLLLGPAWGWYAAAGLFCGLGVVTKGVGFLPLLILIPYAFARRRGWEVPPIRGSPGLWALAPLAFGLAISLWLVPMLIATSGAADPALARYRDEILFRQTVTRFGQAWGHLKPPWYYLTNVVPAVWFPISFLLPWLIPAWVRDLKARNAVMLVLGGWTLLVLVFFSLSAGKRSVYIFPAVPALALIAAPHMKALLSRLAVRRLLFGAGLALSLTILCGGVYALARPDALQRWLDQPAGIARFASVAMGIGLLALTAVVLHGVRRAPAGVAAMLAILWIGTPLLAYPAINASRSGRVITEAAASLVAEGETLGFAGWKEQFLLQWPRPAVHFGFRRPDRAREAEDAAHWLTAAPGRRLLLPEAMARDCYDDRESADLGFAHGERWLLASSDSVKDACRAPTGGTVPSAVRYSPG